MKILIILFSCLLLPLITSCRKEKTVDYFVSPYYYYSEDHSKILYDLKEDRFLSFFSKGSYEEVTTDVENFSVINENFGKDSGNIYYTFHIIENVDYASFIWDSSLGLMKDKNNVYYPIPGSNPNQMDIIKYADPETYEKVDLSAKCLNWYKDKNYYYYNHKKTDADRKTLSFEAVFLPYDYRQVFSIKNNEIGSEKYTGKITVIGNNLLRDNQKYYFNAGCDSTTRYIDYEDLDKFEYYSQEPDHIFRVDNHIYINGLLFLAQIVDAATFTVLEYSYYYKDKNHAYYNGKIIPEASTDSFKALSNRYAKDNKYVYEGHEILPKYKPDEFKEDAWGRFPTDSDYGKSPSSGGSSWRGDDD